MQQNDKHELKANIEISGRCLAFKGLVLTALSFFNSKLCKILPELCRLKGTSMALLFWKHAYVAASQVKSFKATCLAAAKSPGCQTCPGSKTSTRAINSCWPLCCGGYAATSARSSKASLYMSAWG